MAVSGHFHALDSLIPGIPLTGGSVGPTAGLDGVVKGKFQASIGSLTAVIQLVA